jgi:hypothetical protein
MRPFDRIYLSLLVFTLFTFAFAQELPEVSFDPRVWLGSAAALAAFVATAVAFVKRNLIPLHGAATVVASFVLSIGISVGLSFTAWSDASLVDAASFGVTAAVLASGGWDAIKGLLGAVLAGKQPAG